MSLNAGELPVYITATDNTPASTVIPTKRLEINLNYGVLNNTVDILNLKSKALKSVSAVKAAGIGDYTEYGINLNYGLTYHSMLSGSLKKRSISYGSGNLDILTYRYAIRKSFNSVFSLEIGFKGNIADNLKIKNVDEINYYLKKFDNTVTFEVNDKFILFSKKYPDTTVTLGFLKKADPFFEMKDMKDSTKYFRATLGKTFDYFYPNIYLEYGYTEINSKIDSNFKKLIPEKYKYLIPKLPVNLHRNEWYWKFGLSLFFRTPFKTLTSFDYSYIKLNRKSDLSYIDNNHILKGKIGYFLSKRIILSLQGTLLYRQFNGEIPFLYNKYTQTTFDHSYGWVTLGFTYLWR